MITKTAAKESNHFRKLLYYKSARDALFQVLFSFVKTGNFNLLLPAYIGYSSKEGSGIYDPVVQSGISYSFYKIDRKLQINIKDLKEKISKGKNIILLLVNYFGVPDLNYDVIMDLCKKNNIYVIEDAAHALFTDFVDAKCGIKSGCTFYSIHKMLPFSDGGMLKVNTELDEIKSLKNEYRIFNYDFNAIAMDRKRNAQLWNKYITESDLYPDMIKPLYDYRDDVTYQTFPIIVMGDKRDKLYFGLNEKGYGAVSLYHEMIEPIITGDYSDSIWLSEHILNLPVHQDIEIGEIRKMFDLMREIILEGKY